MFLRYLIDAWVRQAAQEKLREAVSEFAPQKSGEESPAADSATAAEALPCHAAFIFALGVESGGLVDRLEGMTRRRFKSRTEYHGLFLGNRVVAVDSGVGEAAARRATERIVARYRPTWIVSAGFAGALRPDVRRGHVVVADAVCDLAGNVLEIGMKMDPQAAASVRGLHVGRLLTVDRLVRTQSERTSLAEAYGAMACDMETAAVAEACRRLKTRFIAVRVVSDALEDEMPPELEALVAQKSSAARLGAAAGAIFRRPSSVKDMWRLKEDAIKASDRLARFLENVCRQLTPADASPP